MSTKDTLFYRKSTSILLDFSASETSTDGSLVLLEKIERKHKLIKKVLRAEKAVRKLQLEHGEKHQHFISFSYQAQSWHKEQRCYSKIERTGCTRNLF